jgi:hypothetical protein
MHSYVGNSYVLMLLAADAAREKIARRETSGR